MPKFTGYIQRILQWGQNYPVPILTPSQTRINATAGATSTAAAALPAGAVALRITATEACWMRFGAAGVGAAAAGVDAMFFPAGVEYIGVPIDTVTGLPHTHFRAIRAGSTDSVIQFEAIQ